MLHYQTLAPATMHERIQKSRAKIINLKYQEEHGMKSSNCLMDLTQCKTCKIIWNTSSKNMK